ncbi:MAG: hypothetical protein IPM79_37205 [Polyangiaceae bacterium]|nr:hypothetical protein [Polyangiaceae bacterium]
MTARPSSHGCATLSAVPSQSSSAGTYSPPPPPPPPSPSGAAPITSIAPGFTFSSQSLQSPCSIVKPS